MSGGEKLLNIIPCFPENCHFIILFDNNDEFRVKKNGAVPSSQLFLLLTFPRFRFTGSVFASLSAVPISRKSHFPAATISLSCEDPSFQIRVVSSSQLTLLRAIYLRSSNFFSETFLSMALHLPAKLDLRRFLRCMIPSPLSLFALMFHFGGWMLLDMGYPLD